MYKYNNNNLDFVHEPPFVFCWSFQTVWFLTNATDQTVIYYHIPMQHISQEVIKIPHTSSTTHCYI